MQFKNKIQELFGIETNIIQGGMVWNSGWRLASAVSNHGGLGLIGAGSMYPDVLRDQIRKCKKGTDKPFGVNVPLLYPDIDLVMQIIEEEEVRVVFTSAGNPKLWTAQLKERGITVVHVVSSVRFAKKAEMAGVDAVVAEGFEAGGHNGREETTTFCLIPDVRRSISLPLIAAGGIATGKQILAAEVLGADGVQLGSRFACTHEASSHVNFKNAVVQANEGDTSLTLKEVTPVRLLRNDFYDKIQLAYDKGADRLELEELLGKGRAKKGMLEGDLREGELEIGQCSSLIDEILTVEQVLKKLRREYTEALNSMTK